MTLEVMNRQVSYQVCVHMYFNDLEQLRVFVFWSGNKDDIWQELMKRDKM